MPEGYKVGKEHPVPMLQELKDLFWWYIDSMKGTLNPEGRPTMKTTLIWAQQFVPGFALKTRKCIPEQDASELYCMSWPSHNEYSVVWLWQWIEKDLVVEKFIKAIKKPKYNVKPGDFERGMRTHWAHDDPIFMSGRFWVQFHFATLLYFCIGARVAALCPKFKDKAKRGLRYEVSALISIALYQPLTCIAYLTYPISYCRCSLEDWILTWSALGEEQHRPKKCSICQVRPSMLSLFNILEANY